jgi:hypothetical protein
MDAGLDTGDMLLVEKIAILPTDTTGSLHDRLAALGGRLMVEALYVGCRVAGYEPVLVWLEKAHQRQGLSLAALQQRFRLPPHRPLPTQRIPQHPLQSYDDLLVLRAQAPGGGGRAADPVAAAAVGADSLPLAEHRLAG